MNPLVVWLGRLRIPRVASTCIVMVAVKVVSQHMERLHPVAELLGE
ncbi:MAG: hypothetical protein NTY60_03010 [Proteobacteria bacterium]|nr:hypothetical protein [Pseudomonadota bacterium]